MTVLTALEQIPIILNAEFSGRVSKAISLITQYEMSTPKSEFDRNTLDHNVWNNRLWLIFRMMKVPLRYVPSKWYAQKLVRLAELSHYVVSKSATEQDNKEWKILHKMLKTLEPMFPNVSKILSVSQVEQGYWF